MATNLLHIHGACHCGAVSYEAMVDVDDVTICHCTDCQNLTGSAYRVTVFADQENFHLTAGTPSIYIKVGSSGGRRAQAFCGTCGSQLYAHADVPNPDAYGLRTGCIRERHALVPRSRVWCKSALEWSADLRHMPAREEG